MCVSALRSTHPLFSRRRFSVFLIPPVLRSGNAYVSSEGYAAPGKSCHSRIYLKVLFRNSVNTRSPLEVPVMSTKGR